MSNPNYSATTTGLLVLDPTNLDGTPIFQVDNTAMLYKGSPVETDTSAASVTAHAGGGQGSATALTASYNLITVCATNYDSVVLPTIPFAGYTLVVKNIGAAIASIFPLGTNTINGLGASNSIDIPALGGEFIFTASSATAWRTPVVVTAPSVTSQTGDLILKATASAGNFQTTITNASQAAARTYTIPDGGADASFALTQGAQTLVGVQTYSAPRVLKSGTTITAFAGGGQASATALTAEWNNVTTVASNFDSVKLLTAIAGQVQTVYNSGAAILSVFPFSGDAINGLAVNLSIDIPVGGEATFTAIDAITWKTEFAISSSAPSTQKGTLVIKAADSAGNTQTLITNASQAAARTYAIPDAGADANFLMTQGAQTVVGVTTFSTGVVLPATNAITAFSGGGQGSATALTTMINRITTCAAAGDSVKLPTATAGLFLVVSNSGAQYANVFPASGDLIDTLAANTAVSLPVGGRLTFTCSVAGTWISSMVVMPAAQFTTGTTTTTFAAGQLTGAANVVYTNTGATPGSIAFRTASQMFTDNPYARVGGTYMLTIVNGQGTGTLTVTGGAAGITLTGTATIAINTSRTFVVTYTSASAVTIVNAFTGTFS